MTIDIAKGQIWKTATLHSVSYYFIYERNGVLYGINKDNGTVINMEYDELECFGSWELDMTENYS